MLYSTPPVLAEEFAGSISANSRTEKHVPRHLVTDRVCQQTSKTRPSDLFWTFQLRCAHARRRTPRTRAIRPGCAKQQHARPREGI